MLAREVSPDLRRVLGELKLGKLLATLPEHLQQARERQMDAEDVLLLVLSDEVQRRANQRLAMRADRAHLSPELVFEAWDGEARVTYDRRLLDELPPQRVDARRQRGVNGMRGGSRSGPRRQLAADAGAAIAANHAATFRLRLLRRSGSVTRTRNKEIPIRDRRGCGGCGGGGVRRIRDSSVLIFPLCERRTFESHRIAPDYDRYVLDAPEFECLGPAIEDILVYVEYGNRTTNMDFKVVLERRFTSAQWVQDDGDLMTWQTPSATEGLLVGTSGTNGSAFGTRAKIGVTNQICVYTRTRASTTGANYVDLSVLAAVRLFN